MALFVAVVIGLSIAARGFLPRSLLGVLVGGVAVAVLIYAAPMLSQGITPLVR